MSKLKLLKKIMMIGALALSVQFLNNAQASTLQHSTNMRPGGGGGATCGACQCDPGQNCVHCPSGACACGGTVNCT